MQNLDNVFHDDMIFLSKQAKNNVEKSFALRCSAAAKQ